MAINEESQNKPKFGAKSDFVRALPRDIPAAEVVALAQLQGVKLTTAFIHNIRSNGKVKAIANGQLKHKARNPTASAEAVLRAAIAQIGLVRAREILEAVEATFAGQ